MPFDQSPVHLFRVAVSPRIARITHKQATPGFSVRLIGGSVHPPRKARVVRDRGPFGSPPGHAARVLGCLEPGPAVALIKGKPEDVMRPRPFRASRFHCDAICLAAGVHSVQQLTALSERERR
jgi:hypothetical protein